MRRDNAGAASRPSDAPDERNDSIGSHRDGHAPSAGVSANAVTLETTRISVSSTGAQGNGLSDEADISDYGRFVAFVSTATNLVPGDTNGFPDVFVRDRRSGVTTRVSVASNGAQANDESDEPAISQDGRFIAFLSFASNLVANDTNGEGDVFVHDRRTGITTRVNVSSAGEEANGFSGNPAISADGTVIAFFSDATNLVPGDTNGVRDVFVRDQKNNTTTRVSVSSARVQSDGTSQLPALNADGRFVAFESAGTTLVAGDTNGTMDAFVHDRSNATTARVSVSTAGVQGNDESSTVAISGDGLLIAFESIATNLVAGDTGTVRDIFVRDRSNNTTTRASVTATGTQSDDDSFIPSLSLDGRYISFHSFGTNYVPNDTNGTLDVFVHTLANNANERVSLSNSGVQGNDRSRAASLSEDGRLVAYSTIATNLITPDSNGSSDVLISDRGGPTSTLVAAVLPSSRSVVVGNAATAFATIINTNAIQATGCQIALEDGAVGDFSYQATDATTNAPIGSPNTPVTIPGNNGAQSFLVSVTSPKALQAVDVTFRFLCAGGLPVTVLTGLNTLLMSASASATPDIVALAATPTANGIVDVPGNNGASAFAIATVNVGVAGNITATAESSDATLPLALFICDTNSSGACLSPPSSAATKVIAAGETSTYTVFVNGAGSIALDPANHRVIVRFKDAGGVTRGSTSVAVRMVGS